MIKLELSEKDIFQIMAGSMEDRVNLLISESVMKEIDLETIKGNADVFKGLGSFDVNSATKNMRLSKWMVEIMSYQGSNTYERFAMLEYPVEFYDQAPEMAALYRNGEYKRLHNFHVLMHEVY